jgi:hypothetical protein
VRGREPRGNTNNQAGVATASHLVINERPPEELRRAQLIIADNVNRDERLTSDLSREFEVMDLLQILGLYRRI